MKSDFTMGSMFQYKSFDKALFPSKWNDNFSIVWMKFNPKLGAIVPSTLGILHNWQPFWVPGPLVCTRKLDDQKANVKKW